MKFNRTGFVAQTLADDRPQCYIGGMQAFPPVEPSRRWYRLHVLTWLVAAVMLGTVLFSQVRTVKCPYLYNTANLRLFGWPCSYIDLVGNRSLIEQMRQIRPPTNYITCLLIVLVIDTTFWSLLIGATLIVVEKRMRNTHRLQFTILGLLKFTTVIAVILALVVRRDDIQRFLYFQYGLDVIFDLGFGYEKWMQADWPIWVPVLFGLGCLVYLIGEFLLTTAARL